jgi:D-beta-D-heptose 7-phosphate kinase/D-beta-D-heptose 1-phosphate adenosyltransferase
VIVKGGDYAPESVVGGEEVRARGGRVVIIPLTPGQSTTSIIEKLRAVNQ